MPFKMNEPSSPHIGDIRFNATAGGGGGAPSTAGQPIGLLLILTKAS